MMSRLSLLLALALALLAPAAQALTIRVVTTATVDLQGVHQGTASGWFDYDTRIGAIVDAEMTTVFASPGKGSGQGKGNAAGHTRTYDETFTEVIFAPQGGIRFAFFPNRGQQLNGRPDITIAFGTLPGPNGTLGPVAEFGLIHPGGASITPVTLDGVSVMSSVLAIEAPLTGTLPLALAGFGALGLAVRRRGSARFDRSAPLS